MKTITEVTYYDAGHCKDCGYHLGVWPSRKQALSSRKSHKRVCVANPVRRHCVTCANYDESMGSMRPCSLVNNLLGRAHRLHLDNPRKGIYQCKSYKLKIKDGE